MRRSPRLNHANIEDAMNGPGKYDDACTAAREHTEAIGVVLIVIGGKHGNGFSVQALEPDLLQALPALLEHAAAQIRADVAQAAN